MMIELELGRGHLIDLIEKGEIRPQRAPSSPTGPQFICDPCGHDWSEHDDNGCLWHLCLCYLPGERK